MTDLSGSTPVRGAARVARCWTVHVAGAAHDVEVVTADGAALADVLPLLGRLLGVEEPALWRGSSPLPPSLPMSAPEVAHGSGLGLGRPGPRTGPADRSGALELHVTGGPHAGRTFPLTTGRHVLGRGSGADVRLGDPDVSREHAVVSVGGGTVTVADLRSTNGTQLAGEGLGSGPSPWPSGTALRLGATSLTLRGPDTVPLRVEPAAGGRVVVHPSPVPDVARPDIEVALPRPPQPPARHRVAWAAVGLPALGGVVMAVVMHAPQYLFFAGLSPVVALGGWWSDRWAGRRTQRREEAAHTVASAAAAEELAAAVAADRRAAEAAVPDLATLTSAARRRSAPLWSRFGDDGRALTVRLGTGRGRTAVTRREADGTSTRQEADHVPVAVDLRLEGGLGVVAPRAVALGVVASVIAQLAVLHPPGEVDLLLLTAPGQAGKWQWARWLPHLRVFTAAEDLERHLAGLPGSPAGSGTRPRTWTVVVVDDVAPPALVSRLRAGRDSGVVVLAAARSAGSLPGTEAAVLRVTDEVGTTGTLRRAARPEEVPLVADRLDAVAAHLLGRDLAALSAPSAATVLPRRVRLLDLVGPVGPPGEADRVAERWSRDRRSLVATLGTAADGPLRIDLCAVGPHALVAGTTGAGKSELLQTLIVGLALQHPPDRCSFLLVDYKGGAALAEAAALPHTVGMLTDLDAGTTTRALRSLAAELTRRETVLADHGVSDIGDLAAVAALARLVIVVDEFAGLAEELPGFVPGLIGIAQRGRSLGVHLVLATQRPGGVVSPEIRANCTLRICLRTTDEADSRDVLGTPDAAHLPLDVPGRAFLRAGSGPPTALQVARVSGIPEPAEAGALVRPSSWPPASRGARTDAEDVTGTKDLARVAEALREAADRAGIPAPHRPWLPPLPDRLTLADLPSPRAGRLLLGLVDRPAAQAREPLELPLAEGGGWLVVGGPRSGRTTLLRTVLAQAVAGSPPELLHVHVLDHGGGALAAEAGCLPQTGTVVGGEDPLRTVRLLDRLTQEVAARRAGTASPSHPALLLLVDGVEPLMAQLDDADPARGSAAFLRLVRDGAAAGLTCVLTADRAVPGGRLAGAVRERLVLALPDRADYAVAGIRPAAVPENRPPGRALVGEDALEAQLVLPPPLPEATALGPARPGGPLRIGELPADPALAAAPDGPRLRIGPGGDEGHPLTVDLARSGGLLVVGPPGSGRSSALDAFTVDLSGAGMAVLRVGHRSPADLPPGTGWLRPDDLGGLGSWLEGLRGATAVVVADDVGTVAEWPVLSSLPGGGRAGEVLVVASGTAGELAGHYQGAVAALRRGRTGLLLCPGPADADLLGVRLPRTPVPVRPGSGWLVSSGGPVRVQVARRRSAQSSSSRGPISCVAYQASS